MEKSLAVLVEIFLSSKAAVNRSELHCHQILFDRDSFATDCRDSSTSKVFLVSLSISGFNLVRLQAIHSLLPQRVLQKSPTAFKHGKQSY